MARVEDFKKMVAAEIIECPDPLVEMYTKRAIIEFAENSWVLTKDFNHSVSSADVETDVNTYVDIDVTDYLPQSKPVFLREMWINNKEYIPYRRDIVNSVDKFSAIYGQDAELGVGVKYFTFPESTIIRIFGVEESDQEIFLSVAFKPLMSAVVVEDLLYEDWVEEIVDGAKWKLFSQPNQKWSDANGAELCRRKFQQGIRRAKARVMNGYNTQPSHVRWRSFGEID